MTQPNKDELAVLASSFLNQLADLCGHNFIDTSRAFEHVMTIFVYQSVTHDREEMFMDIFSRHVVTVVQQLRQEDANETKV